MEVTKLNLTLGSARRELFYRKGTVDEGVIVQALKAGGYDLAGLRRCDELMALYERLAASDKPPLIVDTAANIGAAAVFFTYKFPKARVVAIEPELENFQLLTINTAGLPVEGVQATVAATGSADAAAPRVTVNDIYDKTPDAQPFIVKLDVENGVGLFTAGAEWVARTPVIIAALSDHLIPGTTNSRALVAYAAGWDRDFVYLNDNVFSISRAPDLLLPAA